VNDHDPVCVEANGLTLEIDIAAGAASLDAKLATVLATAIVAANEVAGPEQGEVAVVVDDDERIRSLNKLWRGFDKATNVLSFPAPEMPGGHAQAVGDIAISYETAAREAAAEDKSFTDHMAHLAVHGFLHLLGYDHEKEEEAEEMEGLERVILARVGVADPYIVHNFEG
jgi:probable rRNA maturation factor